MQDEIEKFIEKNKKILPQWILQPELEDKLKIKLKVTNSGFHSCFAKAMKSMRKGNDYKAIKILNVADLKKIKRKKIEINMKMFNNFTYAYKIKK